jgi:hypothetical protein
MTSLLHLELDFSYTQINLMKFSKSFIHFKNFSRLKVLKIYLNGSEIPQDQFIKCEEMITNMPELEIFGIELAQE